MFRLTTVSIAVATTLYMTTAQAMPVNALPAGGQVTQGQAHIQQSAQNMHIQQNSQKAVINWNSFNIGKDAKVEFQQPNAQAATLNRVIHGSSEIAGQLNANGQVYLLNPNGVLFSSTAHVNTASLVVATGNLTDEEFLQGKGTLQHSANAKIINQGNLTTAQGGQIVLASQQIENAGQINAPQGQVQLLAGQSTRINVTADGLIQTELPSGAANGSIKNSGVIRANGGQVDVLASGQNSQIQHTGIIEAQSIVEKDGKIYLIAGYEGQSIAPKTGQTVVDGVLDASAPNGGNGGFIETSAGQVNITDNAKVTTKATQGKSGTWLIDPTDFTINAGNAPQTASGIGATTLENSLNNGSVTIQTSSAGTEQGNIYVNDNIAWSANNLTLTAHNSIHVNAEMNVNSTGTLALNTGATGTVKMAMGENGFVGKINFNGNNLGWGVLEINGQPYYLFNTINDLQDYYANNSHIALAVDINAADTVNWNNGTGFEPLSLNGQIFNGLGHTINNLAINRPIDGDIGLVGTNWGGNISNIGLRNANIRGEARVGGLVGSNVGLIENSFVSGIIGGQSSIGGVVGYNDFGSYFDVQGNLVLIRGIINNSYSTARVVGSSYIGGLVGYNATDIYNSFATGLVEGNSNIGGLAGYNNGEIRNAYAIGQVGGDANIGGLVGENFDGEIVNTYATGPVIGLTNLGGLVGSNSGQISTITNSYWNTETTSQSNAVGLENGSTIATGLTTTQMQQAASFSNWGTNIDAQGGTGATWRIYEGHTAPLLRSFLRPATVRVEVQDNDPESVQYNGQVQQKNFLAAASQYINDVLMQTGTASIGIEGRDVGIYEGNVSALSFITPTGTYAATNFLDLLESEIVSSASLEITPAVLTYSANPYSMTYGTTADNLTGTVTGLVNGETLSDATTGILAFNTDATATSPEGQYAILGSGLSAANYIFEQAEQNNTALTVVAAPINPNPIDPNPINPDPIEPDPINPDPTDPTEPDPTDPDFINPEAPQISHGMIIQPPVIPPVVIPDVLQDFQVLGLDECSSSVISADKMPSDCIVSPKVEIQVQDAADDDGSIATPIQTKRALIIANSDYQVQNDLMGVRNDSAEIERTLKQQGYQVTVVRDAKRGEMVQAFNRLIHDSQQDDSVLIYYAGHGFVDAKSSIGYWLPVDAAAYQATEVKNWISNVDISKAVKNIAAKQILLVSDSCFSGALSYEGALQQGSTLDKNAVLKRRSVMVMTSGSEEVVKDQAANGLSPFATAMLQGLKQTQGRDLRGQNLYQTVYKQVTGNYAQYPTYGSLPSAGHHAGGEYIFELK